MNGKKYNFCLTVVGARNLDDVSTTGNLDPFVRISYNNNTYQSMVHKRAGSNPKWDYEIYLWGDEDEVTVEVCDYGLLRTKSIGTCRLNLSKVTHLIQKAVPITRGPDNKFCGEIIISLRVYKNNPLAPKHPASRDKSSYGSSNGSYMMGSSQCPMSFQHGYNSPPSSPHQPNLSSSMPPILVPNPAMQQGIQPPRFLRTSFSIPQIVPTSIPVQQSVTVDNSYSNEQSLNPAKSIVIPPIPRGMENTQINSLPHALREECREQEYRNERGERVCITQSCSTANSGSRNSSGPLPRSFSTSVVQSLHDSPRGPHTPRSDYYQENYQNRNIPPSHGKNVYTKQPVKNNSLRVCSC